MYNKIVTSLGKKDFDHRITYVALSRATKLENSGIAHALLSDRIGKQILNEERLKKLVLEERRVKIIIERAAVEREEMDATTEFIIDVVVDI